MRRGGFLLVLSLMVTILIAVIALSLLSVRRGSYANSRAVVEAAQARALAVSGLEDLRVKLAKDPFFPTGIGDEQVIFTYAETVRSLASSAKIGSYQVTMDRSHRDPPRQVLRLESTGMVGDFHAEAPRFTIYAELDLRDFSFKVWQEGAASSL